LPLFGQDWPVLVRAGHPVRFDHQQEKIGSSMAIPTVADFPRESSSSSEDPLYPRSRPRALQQAVGPLAVTGHPAWGS
jgi:hypothetical protein